MADVDRGLGVMNPDGFEEWRTAPSGDSQQAALRAEFGNTRKGMNRDERRFA